MSHVIWTSDQPDDLPAKIGARKAPKMPRNRFERDRCVLMWLPQRTMGFVFPFARTHHVSSAQVNILSIITQIFEWIKFLNVRIVYVCILKVLAFNI